ncbi:MAG: PEP/pyruvate-binding domain-containing protein [Clostridia bacterium]|nr:PEP/pyruvate-binding domain-containing protein [Clostridia bacterium]
MIFKLGEREEDDIGNKAKYLSIIKNHGFNVPNGIVIDKDELVKILKENHQFSEYKRIIEDLNDSKNVDDNIVKIEKMMNALEISEDTMSQIMSNLDISKKYAVRSSASKEDLNDVSFAGQYVTTLNVCAQDIELADAIKKCYISCFGEKVVKYCVDHKINIATLEMNIIIQEMVDSEYSGVLFGVNPITGNDKELVIEIARGLGENVVSGKVIPKKYIFHFDMERFVEKPKVLTIDDVLLEKLIQEALKMQKLLGFPIDMEFGIYKNDIYFLQVRCITKIGYHLDNIVWTNANFKDGGVSSGVCTPYMWSLYQYIWENSLREFLIRLKILKENEIDANLGKMFFSRPYWNVSVVKRAMEKIPGYIERDFDDELGITPLYGGNGKSCKLTLSGIVRVINIYRSLGQMIKNMKNNSRQYIKTQKELYKSYIDTEYEHLSNEEFFQLFEKLVQDDFLKNDSLYFTQIFINTVKQTIFKRKIKKYLDQEEYLNLLSGIDNVSHLLPFYDLWKISEKIKQDKSIYDYFVHTDIDRIYERYLNHRKDLEIFDDISVFIKKYEYHSFKELDITFPSYSEDVFSVLKMFQATVKLSKKYSPMVDKKKGREKFKSSLKILEDKTNKIKFNKLKKEIYEMRDLLWLREELKDLSTRFYYVIRIYTLEFSRRLKEDKLIEEVNDIFYLSKDDIWEYIHNKKGIDYLNKMIEKNKIYFNSFKNYIPKDEIFDTSDTTKIKENSNNVIGVGCSSGIVTAKARLIEDFSKIDEILPGEILVTRFTDTGWTSKFAILGGMITENGGMLCHLAITAREYNLPCIVSVKNVMNIIKDGDIVTMNGASGDIIIEDKDILRRK